MRTLMAALALFVGASSAGPILDQAATSLRQNPVYVHPGAERSINPSQAEEIRSAIRAGDKAVYIAVLPTAAESESPNGITGLPAALGEQIGLAGTYGVVTGTGFRGASNALPDGVAARIATNAFNDHKSDGAAAVLLAFVDEIEAYDGTSPVGASDGSPVGSSSRGGSSPLPWILTGGAVGAVFLVVRSSRKRRKQEANLLAGDKADLRAELSVLADDVMRLEPEVGLHPEARDDYEAGVARYKWALVAVDGIDSIDDPPRVRRGMVEAKYAMARARAMVQGYAPPDPPPELQHPGSYGEPAVELDEERQPRYSGQDRGGWRGGGYYGGNDFFTGIVLGQVLGGGHGASGWGGGFTGAGSGNDSSGGGFGSSGGGDWGGGGGSSGSSSGGGGGGSAGGGDW